MMDDITDAALRAARELAPAVSGYAAQAERARHLPAELVRQLAQAGLFRIFQPRIYGGLELDIVSGLQILEEISAADGSTGWCLLKGSTSNQMSGYLPETTARNVWQDPLTVVAGNFNPGKGRARQVPGGYLLTGHWDWGTGSTHSSWLIGGAFVVGENGEPLRTSQGGPIVKALLFERERAELIDTWFAHGMKATGSGDFAVKDLFVSDDYVFDGMLAAPRISSHLYALPYAAQAMVAHAPVAIGIARGALTSFIELARKKVPLMGTTVLRERQNVQDGVGRATAIIDSSRAYVHSAATRAWEEAARGAVSQAALTQLFLSATHATHACVSAVDLLYGLAGGSAVFLESPIQRAFHDIHVAASHFIVNQDKYAVAGMATLRESVEE